MSSRVESRSPFWAANTNLIFRQLNSNPLPMRDLGCSTFGVMLRIKTNVSSYFSIFMRNTSNMQARIGMKIDKYNAVNRAYNFHNVLLLLVWKIKWELVNDCTNGEELQYQTGRVWGTPLPHSRHFLKTSRVYHILQLLWYLRKIENPFSVPVNVYEYEFVYRYKAYLLRVRTHGRAQ